MVDKINLAVIKAQDMRCSNCFYGHQIVASIGGGDIDEEGNEITWRLTEPRKIGMTRNCFSFLQKAFLRPEKFIYPKEDDSCINTKKFRKK